jgi:hypothetical protein
MICVAHLTRDETDSKAVYMLPEAYAEIDKWMGRHGDRWMEAHHNSLDSHVALNVGFQWEVDDVEFFESVEQFHAEFVGCNFLEDSYE